MKAVKIEGESRPIGAPRDWIPEKHGHCGALFVRDDLEAGLHFMRSAWEASADEAGWILAGAKVQLGICAPEHPVVNMGLGPTPLEALPVYTIRQITDERGNAGVRVSMFAPRRGLTEKIGGHVWAEVPVGGDGLPTAVAKALLSIAALAEEKGIA